LLRAVLSQVHHLAADDVRQHGPKALALPSLDLIEADVPRPVFWTPAIPVRQKRQLRSTGLVPADTVAHRRVTRRHRLTVQPDLLPQASGDPRFRISELDPLSPNAAPRTDDAPLQIDERYVILATRNPDSPRIRVQSRRDPTRPPVVAHQKKTTRIVGCQVGSHSQ
jgi:hypothetical protein